MATRVSRRSLSCLLQPASGGNSFSFGSTVFCRAISMLLKLYYSYEESTLMGRASGISGALKQFHRQPIFRAEGKWRAAACWPTAAHGRMQQKNSKNEKVRKLESKSAHTAAAIFTGFLWVLLAT
jgi:hypothetical protein